MFIKTREEKEEGAEAVHTCGASGPRSARSWTPPHRPWAAAHRVRFLGCEVPADKQELTGGGGRECDSEQAFFGVPLLAPATALQGQAELAWCCCMGYRTDTENNYSFFRFLAAGSLNQEPWGHWNAFAMVKIKQQSPLVHSACVP